MGQCEEKEDKRDIWMVGKGDREEINLAQLFQGDCLKMIPQIIQSVILERCCFSFFFFFFLGSTGI
jgi:hypothetical protein